MPASAAGLLTDLGTELNPLMSWLWHEAGPRVFALSGKDLLAGTQTAAVNFFAEFLGPVDGRGGVRVAAKDLETGREQSITVTATSGLTEDELQKLVESSQNYMVEVRASEEFERQRQQAERLINEVRELFPQVQGIMSGTSFGRDAIAKAEGVLERADQEIRNQDARSLEEVVESLERTLNMFRGVVSKTGLS